MLPSSVAASASEWASLESIGRGENERQYIRKEAADEENNIQGPW